jgi:cytochrome o ubiquinol oxidase subunit III
VTDVAISRGRDDPTDAEGTERALDEKTCGFWIGLMTDAIIFALLLATFAVMSLDTADGLDGQALLPLPLAQTLLLLASSMTFGCATAATTAGHRRATAWLGATFLLGAGFVAMEISQFQALIAAGAVPSRNGFLSAFFTLVGTHGIHVGVGLLWVVLLAGEIALRGLNPFVASRLYRLGLFWHFLVTVWIAILSVVYLPSLL